MQYTGLINYQKCWQFGLNLSQGAVMDIMLKLSTWATGKEINGKIYYYLSAGKMVEMLPVVSDKKNTFLVIVKSLIDIGLVERVQYEGKSYYCLSETGKLFDNGVENFQESDEKNQEGSGKKSTPSVEKNQDNTRINNTNTNDKESYALGEASNGETPIIPLEDRTEDSNTPLPPSFGKKEINEVIDKIKSSCRLYGLVYTGDARDRQYAGYLLSKKFYCDIAEFDLGLLEFIDNIIKAGAILKYGKPVTSAKTIYYNRGEVINKVRKQKTQEDSQKKKTYILT